MTNKHVVRSTSLSLWLALVFLIAGGSQAICQEDPTRVCDSRLGCLNPNPKRSRIVLWHQSWGENPNNISLLGRSKFVTHVVIGNLDYNEQPQSSVSYKVNLIKQAGMIPVWERDLWFQDTDHIGLPEAAHFIEEQKRGILHLDPYFYAWFLNKLQKEARQHKVSLTFIDIEPHDEAGVMRQILKGDGTSAWANSINKIARRALLIPGTVPAHFVSPSDMFIIPNNGFRALSRLGNNRIAVNTYFNCLSRLNWSREQQFEFIGLWTTSLSSCHRDGNSCELSTYGKSCAYTEESSNRALWSIDDIFKNEVYWRGMGRGLFLYANDEQDDFAIPKLLFRYCHLHPQRCKP